MKLMRTAFAVGLMLVAATALAGGKEKELICHVGNEVGPNGEEYLDDPGCVPVVENDYFCPNAGKIDLIEVPNVSKHLGNPSHSYGGISDYRPGDVGASGEGDTDTDNPPDGVDEGCEPPSPYTVVDFADMSASTGGSSSNFAVVQKIVPDGNGNNVTITILLTDTNLASDGGYHFIIGTWFSVFSPEPLECRYPIVQLRGRATIGAETYRMDFDGYAVSGITDAIDLPGPWDYQNGDYPTIFVESVTVDFSAPPTCTPF